MGNEVREKNSPIRGNQVQGLKKCTRRTSGVCNQLLGYFLFIGGLEKDKISDYILNSAKLAYTANCLCTSVSKGQSGRQNLHEIPQCSWADQQKRQ